MFGFTSFSWNSNGKMISLGDYSGVVTILDGSKYVEIISYHETDSIDCEKTTVYKVSPKSVESGASGNVSSSLELFEVLKGEPFVLASLATHSEKSKSKHAKYGIRTLRFSHCGNYLLSLNDVSWHPTKSLLAFCCGSQNVYLWTPTCCISLWSPFRGECPSHSVQWCSRRNCLLLNGKNHSALLYLPDVDPHPSGVSQDVLSAAT
ncbi:unnamed protein product [Larinioides sclopetarius]|uniref:Uncharacterized protein n=1 Tax=Larinioides sclopetarius TaxID=280406 RepID=A0AAV2BX67_9ARAC